MKKANLLNAQFQSVFTPKSPLQLKQLCQKKVQDLHDAGNYSQDMSQPLDDIRNKYPNMPDLKISVNGIIKLLQGLKPDKAPGPDQIRPLLLQKLCLEIAPILSFSPSPWKRDLYHLNSSKQMSHPFSKREKSPILQITGPYPSLAYFVKYLNT